MRLWFMGEGVFASMCLRRLHSLLGSEIERVYTGLPVRVSRGGETPSPVEEAALERGFEMGGNLFRAGPLPCGDGRPGEGDRPDAVFVVDFGRIIREPLLSAPKYGCVNIHPSLLPRWRGAAPVQRALMNGDTEVGVTVFRLVPEMDAGPVISRVSVAAGLDAGASKLYEKLSELGSAAAAEGLRAMENGTAELEEQDGSMATYAPKLSRGEFEVSWLWPAMRAHNTVRALDMSGGAFVSLEGGRRLKLWRTAPDGATGEPGVTLTVNDEGITVACGEGSIRLLEVQAEGRRRMPASEWARGSRLCVGKKL